MRLLIVNPNTSPGVTRTIAAAARAVARPGDRFVTVAAASGPRLIVTPQDAELAARGVLQSVERHRDPVDGIILASFGDTGDSLVRRARPDIPVIGISAGAFGRAREMDVDYAVVTFSADMAPALAARAAHHGADERLIRIACAQAPAPADAERVQITLRDELRDLCLDCVRRGAGAIVFGGGPLAGFAATVADEIPVPLIDGTQASIAMMRARVAAAPEQAGTAT